MRRGLLVAATVCLVAGSAALAGQDTTRADALALQKKFADIALRGLQPAPRTPTLVRTSFTERELNAYLSVNGPVIFPTGVTRPEVGLDDAGKFRAKAVVDLNAVKNSQPRGWLDPLAYLSGSLDLTTSGQLQTANGTGTLTIESATLGGIPVPVTLLQELVAFYSKSPENPAGFDLTKPFELPSNIRSIETRRAAATIVQAVQK